ncbi:MAG: glycoside hydrolase family 15 protein [Acidimicrobiales bacterium]
MTQPTPDALVALEGTTQWWRSWVRACTYQGPWRDAVVRSLVTLKALTYAETGGIVAAPTTSLPETHGGTRNWDYRFCWLRDASLTLRSLMGSGFAEEAYGWREWLLRATAGRPSDLQTMYALDGSRRMPETVVPHLSGYEGALPVRVGNAAADQFQLDAIGEVIHTLVLARLMGLPETRGSTDFQRLMLDHLSRVWRLPDEGIWEVRSGRRHFVHSKVTAWAAFDSSVRCAEAGLLKGPLQQWRAGAEAIRAEVLDRGYDRDLGYFTSSYGSGDLDASLLLIGQNGFLPLDDPRVLSTIEAVQRDLTVDGLVMRYKAGPSYDGVDAGDEGAFIACSFWMVDALCGAGRRDEAAQMFERLLGLTNDLGLLAEEYDPASGRQIGNFPQAFSHLGLIASAANLTGARAATFARRRDPSRGSLYHPSSSPVLSHHPVQTARADHAPEPSHVQLTLVPVAIGALVGENVVS